MKVQGEFRHDLEQLFGVTAIDGRVGHHVLTPLVRPDGVAVMIDRGWVPADQAHPPARRAGQIEGPVRIAGIARYRGEDRPGWFTPDNRAEQSLWYWYDMPALERALGLQLLPVVVEADATPNPGGLPIGGRSRAELPNNHLQYAITWYGLAAGLLASASLQPGAGPATMRALRRATGRALLLTYAVIVLGAWVRATGSGLACPDWPTCYGHWVPLPGEIPPDAGYAYDQVMLEWVHRLLAGVILGPLILLIGWLAWRARDQNPRIPVYAAVLFLLLLIQAVLGGVTVLDQNSPWSVALHLGTALLLLSGLCLIFDAHPPAVSRPRPAPARSAWRSGSSRSAPWPAPP